MLDWGILQIPVNALGFLALLVLVLRGLKYEALKSSHLADAKATSSYFWNAMIKGTFASQLFGSGWTNNLIFTTICTDANNGKALGCFSKWAKPQIEAWNSAVSDWWLQSFPPNTFSDQWFMIMYGAVGLPWGGCRETCGNITASITKG